MNKQRVRAFTIMEVTITMLIAGILIAITYTSYSIIIKSYRSFTAKNEDIVVLVSLDHVLQRDFDRADIILKQTDGITLKNSNQMIKYTFSPDFITRIASKMDTFKVQTQEVNTSFDNIPMGEVQADDEQNRLDDLAFTLVFQNEKIPYHYHKLYSSDNLINRNPHANN
jgi:prepilin-type N-terminal cleavage/methylation domain-containing protein